MNDYARFENDGRPKDVLNKPVLILVLLLGWWLFTYMTLSTMLMLGLAIWLIVVMNGDWAKFRNVLFSLCMSVLFFTDGEYEIFVFTVLMMAHIVILLWLAKVAAFYAIYHKRASLWKIAKGQAKAEVWALVLIPLLYLVFTYLFYFLTYQNNLQFFEKLWEQIEKFDMGLDLLCFLSGGCYGLIFPLYIMMYGYWGASIDYHYLSQAVYGRKLKYWEAGAEHMIWVLLLLNLLLYWKFAMLYNLYS